MERNAKFSGTNFHCIFQTANRGYDRIIILSDMQALISEIAAVEL
jgi:hypothetical protein